MIIIPNYVWATLLKPLMNLKQAKYGRMPVTLVTVYMLEKVCNYSLATTYHSLSNILIYVYPTLSQLGEPEDNLSDQPVDRFENNDLISKIEEIPEAIADLRDTMFCTSKQSQLEDQEFEEKLHKALTIQPMRSQPLKSTPKKLKLLPPGNLEDNFNLLERTLDRSRREDIHFESFLKRAMEE